MFLHHHHQSITIHQPSSLAMSAQPGFAEARTYIENLLAYHFRVVTNLEEALWAYPATLSNGSKLPDGNKSLAVVGDAALNLVVKHHCYVLKMKRGELKYSRLFNCQPV